MSDILTKGIYDNKNSALVYVGTWGSFVKEGLTMIFSSTKGSYLEFSFLGTGFRWYTQTNAWRGLAKVYIDSVEKATIDTYSASEVMNVLAYEVDNLSNETHTVKIEVLGQGNSKAIEYKVVIYNIEILGNETTTTVIPVTSLTFESEEVTLNEGETYQLKWSIEPEDATDKTVKFESGNTGFVTVDSNGLLNYVNEGETNICATTSNNISVYVKVICKIKESISSPVTTDDEIPIIQEDIVIDESRAIDSTNLINEGIFIANEGGKLEIGDKVKIIAHILPYYWYNTNPYILKSNN